MKFLMIGVAALSLAACNTHEMNTTDVDDAGLNTMAGNDIVPVAPGDDTAGGNIDLIGNAQRTDELGAQANATE